MRPMPEINFGTPRLITEEEAAEARASQKLRQLVWLILNCSDPHLAIADPKATYHDLLTLLPDLPREMCRAAELVMVLCKQLEHGRQ